MGRSKVLSLSSPQRSIDTSMLKIYESRQRHRPEEAEFFVARLNSTVFMIGKFVVQGLGCIFEFLSDNQRLSLHQITLVLELIERTPFIISFERIVNIWLVCRVDSGVCIQV